MEELEQSQKEVAGVFLDSWRELVEEYRQKRILPIWCSEADIKMHLANKLLNRYASEWIHRELPIPIDVKRFPEQLWLLGKVARKNCIIADICIIDHEKLLPCLIAEVKFSPFFIGFRPILEALEAKEKGKRKNYVEIVKRALKEDINKLKMKQEYGPSEEILEKEFLGRRRKDRPTQVEKLIKVLKNFEKEGISVSGFWCVIDENYLNLEERLKREINRLNPPRQFELLYQPIDIKSVLEKNLRHLELTNQ
jgi:hypothetical protein